ncbi:MAG: hypothetical protein EB010_12430 [Acidimicrobiia bacterium]|jgi:hypothetical protein|nr:hypothetical protein [Actinomycetota bacterium]NDE60200.1 hypothetical protein [Acidimicrobiia bacterium]NDE81925.1 hypothetical protein [Actinomycetota bacterium]
MKDNINSGHDYAKILIDTLRETPDPLMPQELLDYWCENIYDMAVKSYNDYIVGKKDYFELSMEEVEKAYEDAGLKYTQDILNGMLDKDLIKALIDETGEIVYSLTEKGKKYRL